MHVTAKTSFVHCALVINKGETSDLPDQLSKDLIAAGLVVLVKKAPEPLNKMASKVANKGDK